jgi:hypothetical protein
VSAPSKRRRVSYYLSLPVVAVVVVFLATRLVAMQRAEIIEQLTEQIARSEPSDASAAIRQLGDMPNPPVGVLVAAATGGDSKVAREAQQTVDRMLRRWQRQVGDGRGMRGVSRGLTELAEALRAQQNPLTLADREWLVSATQKILSLANKMPSKHAPMVATSCDAILASLSQTKDAQVTTTNNANVDAAPRELVSAASDELHANVAEQEEADVPEENPLKEYHRAEWSRPVFRMIPAERNGSTPSDAGPSNDSPAPSKLDDAPTTINSDRAPFANLDSRSLLKRWLTAEGGELVACAEELIHRRGFGRLSKGTVEQLFSGQAPDRVQLVDEVLTTPGINARPWLLLLVDDTNADVRLAAVSVMATSSDPDLVEKAWQTAIRDRDPRIASLAGRLRERRSAIQRR